ncbi:hypothetical protein C8R45DRAFT_927895 [Mycena sanguinolenta]|nr:hypothetical protein C8R45DRAFT_927895 [Mycena sanguinolenta]
MNADSTYHERCWRRNYIEKYGCVSFHDFYLPLVDFFVSDTLNGVTIVDKTQKQCAPNFYLPITEEFYEAKKKFWQGTQLLFLRTETMEVYECPHNDYAPCPTVCLHPKTLNFESYSIHDEKRQHFYWVVLDGYYSGIYTLESMARDRLPLKGRFGIVRCQAIAEAVYSWRDTCKDKHAFTCDPAELEITCQKMAEEVAKLGGSEMVPDSDNETLTPTTHFIDIMSGPGPDPEQCRPMCPAIFPLDETTASRFRLKADSTRMAVCESPGFRQEGSSRRISPSNRRVNVERSPSHERKVPLFIDDDEKDDQSPCPPESATSHALPTAVASASSLSASVTSASSLSACFTSTALHAPQSWPVLESASTAHSTKQMLVGSQTALGPKDKFKPLIAVSRTVNEHLAGKSTSSPKTALTASTSHVGTLTQTPLNGPIYFNHETQIIYCDLDTALQEMVKGDRLAVINTARSMARAIKVGGVLATKQVKQEVKQENNEIIEIQEKTRHKLKAQWLLFRCDSRVTINSFLFILRFSSLGLEIHFKGDYHVTRYGDYHVTCSDTKKHVRYQLSERIGLAPSSQPTAFLEICDSVAVAVLSASLPQSTATPSPHPSASATSSSSPSLPRLGHSPRPGPSCAENPEDLVLPVETLATEEGSTEDVEMDLEPGSSDEDTPEWHRISPAPQSQTKVTKRPLPPLGNNAADDDDDDDDAALPEVPGLTTWAKDKHVIGPEQRRTSDDKAKSKKRRMADLQADIVQHNLERRELVDELAAKHKFKAKQVKQRLTSLTVFKKSRKPSLFRAKLHYLSKVLNEGSARLTDNRFIQK